MVYTLMLRLSSHTCSGARLLTWMGKVTIPQVRLSTQGLSNKKKGGLRGLLLARREVLGDKAPQCYGFVTLGKKQKN